MSLKGVSPVRVLAVVLYAYKTLGNSFSQAPFASFNQVLMIFSGIRFITSVHSLACGCLIDENWFLIPNLEQKSLKSWLSNCRPLFDMIVRGILNLQKMFFHTKFWIFALVMVGSASTSTHFVK